MGIWDFIKSSTSPVTNPFRTSYNYGSAFYTSVDNLQMLNQLLPSSVSTSKIGIFATILANAIALIAHFKRDAVMDNTEDMVWILVCYPIKYEESVEGVWKWKYAENDKRRITPILVSNTISYVELYDKVKEELGIDTRLYKMEMSALNPIMHEALAPPIVIDCDNNVKWFVSVCRETFLCITISDEIVDNREEFGDDVSCQLRVKKTV
ncbi:uncharacterized protein LOC111370754 [Olea europaea var. sylvestris]|uniref:uncharacterized protein LOC111370754 n=1 Tax=Olea europaea var. sylvestris TaxID=158386 RepID=UPI000C1D8C11|nr:uncharacterized protein LOC111370754 [Olea europaea var. sylvestris]